MKGLKWATGVCSALMVLFAFGGGYGAAVKALWGASADAADTLLLAQRLSSVCVTAAAMMAVAAAWTGAKIERPAAVVGIGMAAALVPALGALAVMAARTQEPALLAAWIRSGLLIAVLLLAIVWLVGGMIRRNLTEREKQ